MNLVSILESFALQRTSDNDHQAMFSGFATDDTGKRVFGGQVMGQAMSAAQLSVPDAYRVHSLHCSFILPGDPNAPIFYQVDKLRTGRSFAVRNVTAIQHEQPIFNANVSLQKAESGLEHADTMPSAPAPETLVEDETRITEYFTKRGIDNPYEWPLDVRFVDPMNLEDPQKKAPYDLVWMRVKDSMPADAQSHSQMLAYISDNPIAVPAFSPHASSPFLRDMQSITLNHALWIHHTFNVNDWLLFEINSEVASGGRGMCHAKVFASDGSLVATATQELLMRKRG